MAIKRVATQQAQQLQAQEHLTYSLSKSSPSKKTTEPLHSSVLGIKTTWIFQDLKRTFWSTLLLVAVLIAVKLSQVLS